jgi:S-DNA-T family DNA segregation ATPase FtsK/SpoIIIE
VDAAFDPADGDLDAALTAGKRRLAVVVDDAELVAESAAAAILDRFIRGARDAGNLLIVAGAADELSVGFRGFVVDARRARTGLLMAPRGPLDGEVLGIRLPRSIGAGGAAPPGRALFVHHGAARPLQIALPG